MWEAWESSGSAPTGSGEEGRQRPEPEIPLQATMLTRGSERGSGENFLPRNTLDN